MVFVLITEIIHTVTVKKNKPQKYLEKVYHSVSF